MTSLWAKYLPDPFNVPEIDSYFYPFVGIAIVIVLMVLGFRRWRGGRRVHVKRLSIKLLLFLLAGAILNVAVAWGCTVHLQNSKFAVKGSWPSPRICERVVIGANQVCLSAFDYECLAGLPFRSLHSRLHASFDEFLANELAVGKPNQMLPRRISEGIAMPRWLDVRGDYLPIAPTLPAIPIFPGFAINTIFYVVVLWLLIAAPGAIRRRIRTKRGQCASCGYSLRESASEKCPECGCSAPSPAISLKRERAGVRAE